MGLVYAGGTYANSTFTGDTRWAIMKNLRDNLVTAGWTNVAQASGQGPGNAATVTITIASPGVVTMTGHGFLGGERVLIATTGALPTGLAVATIYFVKYIDANTFNLSTTSGGSNINTSGSQSGAHTLYTESMLLQSATQSGVANPIRLRMKDYLGNGPVGFGIENSAGSLTSTINTGAGGFLLPATAQTMRVIATKYWFTCLVPGSASARTFIIAGMPYVDSSFLTSVTDIGFLFANAPHDNTTTANGSFRTQPSLTGGNSSNYILLLNSSLWQNNNNGSASSNATAGAPEVIISCQPAWGQTSTARNYRWGNDDLLTSDVLVGWGLTGTTDECKIRGQFYDMMYVAEAVAIDTSSAFTATGHTFFNLTNNWTQVSGNAPRGGMWVRTDT
jgi:hypothetical protein